VLTAVNVVFVKVSVKPTHSEIVRNRHDPCRSNSVVCPDVRNYRNLTRKPDIREQKLQKQLCKWPAYKPKSDKIEQKLVTPVRVLLLTGEFVIHCK
jgi:hypothetical protein